MKRGEEARLTCRGDHAYGPKGFPAWGIGPNATLIFDIEILSIN
jgi:FKBP-type peptidyl-prolyl cis-trans isomerase